MSSALAPLWSIEDHLQALLDTVEACPDELKPEIQAEINEYIGQELTKVDQVAHVLAALDYEQKCAADEIARLQERKKAAKAAQDRLEAYVCRVIKMRGVKKLEGKTNTLSIRPSDAVKILDETRVPAAYRSVCVVLSMPAAEWAKVNSEAFVEMGAEISFSTDKMAIKKALKAGEEVPGADLEFRDNLQRK